MRYAEMTFCLDGDDGSSKGKSSPLSVENLPNLNLKVKDVDAWRQQLWYSSPWQPMVEVSATRPQVNPSVPAEW
jgi:hypothetical protein